MVTSIFWSTVPITVSHSGLQGTVLQDCNHNVFWVPHAVKSAREADSNGASSHPRLECLVGKKFWKMANKGSYLWNISLGLLTLGQLTNPSLRVTKSELGVQDSTIRHQVGSPNSAPPTHLQGPRLSRVSSAHTYFTATFSNRGAHKASHMRPEGYQAGEETHLAQEERSSVPRNPVSQCWLCQGLSAS